MTHKIAVLILFLTLALCPSASAHRLMPNDGSHLDAETALFLEDVSISQLVLHEVTEDGPEVWLSFMGQEGQEVYLQLGMPVLDRLENYSPAVALLGPGLPEVKPPFEVPDGLGGLLFPSKWQEQEHFYEPFTGTESWILLEQNVTLPADGQCFVVGYHPDGQPGKLWVSVGRREEFGLLDILGMPAVVREVRTFHEVIGERLSFLTSLMVTLAYLLLLLFILLGTWLLRTLAVLFRLLS